MFLISQLTLKLRNLNLWMKIETCFLATDIKIDKNHVLFIDPITMFVSLFQFTYTHSSGVHIHCVCSSHSFGLFLMTIMCVIQSSSTFGHIRTHSDERKKAFGDWSLNQKSIYFYISQCIYHRHDWLKQTNKTPIERWNHGIIDSFRRILESFQFFS